MSFFRTPFPARARIHSAFETTGPPPKWEIPFRRDSSLYGYRWRGAPDINSLCPIDALRAGNTTITMTAHRAGSAATQKQTSPGNRRRLFYPFLLFSAHPRTKPEHQYIALLAGRRLYGSVYARREHVSLSVIYAPRAFAISAQGVVSRARTRQLSFTTR